jgi:hypothetical protein
MTFALAEIFNRLHSNRKWDCLVSATLRTHEIAWIADNMIDTSKSLMVERIKDSITESCL